MVTRRMLVGHVLALSTAEWARKLVSDATTAQSLVVMERLRWYQASRLPPITRSAEKGLGARSRVSCAGVGEDAEPS